MPPMMACLINQKKRAKMLDDRLTVLSQEQEKELVDHIKNMESAMYGLMNTPYFPLSSLLNRKNNISHPFSVNKEKAGNDWFHLVKKDSL